MIGPPQITEQYPFSALNEKRDALRTQGVSIIDFGQGDPREPTPQFIRDGLASSINPISSYPKAAGLPELRLAIAQWVRRRFDIEIDPDTSILPTLGSKEIIHSLPAYLLTETRNTVVIPSLAYPVYERGATFHGAKVEHIELSSLNRFIPDLAAVPSETWKRTALLWLNYPNNPTGANAPFSFIEQAADLARRYGFIVAFDEAYSEIWFNDVPPSGLQLSDYSNVLVVNTLSKRSCMTGYRSGFIAGDKEIIGRLKAYRPSVGVTPQEFVQNASILAWNDDRHVEELRHLWSAKRNLLLDVFHNHELHTFSDATFFIWIQTPINMSAETFAEWLLLNTGIVVSPGTFFGSSGEGYVRMALVPSLQECELAAQSLNDILSRNND